MPDQASAAHSAVMAVHRQQRRIDRLRGVRMVARTLTVLALAAFAAAALFLDHPAWPGSPLVRTLLGGGVLAWLLALVGDYRVHSNRLTSRILQMQLLSVQDKIDEITERDEHRLGPSRRLAPGTRGPCGPRRTPGAAGGAVS